MQVQLLSYVTQACIGSAGAFSYPDDRLIADMLPHSSVQDSNGCIIGGMQQLIWTRCKAWHAQLGTN